MMTTNLGIPRLSEVLSGVLERSLCDSVDKWVRAEVPTDWPVAGALSCLCGKIPGFRIGILRPFAKNDVGNIGCQTSDNPQEITGWRNQSVDRRRENPTVILGDARGPEEAGLRVAPCIVTDTDVLRCWGNELERWLKDSVDSDTPIHLVRNLIELTLNGTIDAVRLDEYLQVCLRQPQHLLLGSLRTELWRVNLCPDDRVLDAGASRRRLDLGIETRRLLLAASDSLGDLNQLNRLRQAAEDGNEVAHRALRYRATRNCRDLMDVELEELQGILAPGAQRDSNGTEVPLGLADLLNAAATADADAVIAVIKVFDELANGWDLKDPSEQTLRAYLEVRQQPRRAVSIEVKPAGEHATIWLRDETPSGQVVAFLSEQGARRDWLSCQADGKPITAENLLERARSQDKMLDTPKFESLVTAYISARAELGPFEQWLVRSAFELLVLNQKAREAVRGFLDAWRELIQAASQIEHGKADVIRGTLILLEAQWGMTGQDEKPYNWCVLGPLHPYLLDPIHHLAEYTLASLGREHLGDRVSWARDRCLPAYRALWAPNATLLLDRDGEIYEFQVSPRGFQPRTDEGEGIYQVAKAFLGFHPYAFDGLVITLIDPPKGKAIEKNLRRLARDVQGLRVYLVSTRGDAAQLEACADIVHNLGRFSSVDEWLTHTPVHSHLAFYFTSHQIRTANVAIGGSRGPVPGAHVALRIQCDGSPAYENPNEMVPYVTFEPRENNGPVVAIWKLAASSLGAPRLFQVQPMLGRKETKDLEQIAHCADWVVIGAQSPLGLIAPRELGKLPTGEKLTFLGRESLGAYGLFVYASSMFAVRKLVMQQFRSVPVVTDRAKLEERLVDLAVHSANGILRVGRSQGQAMWEQVGLVVSSLVGPGVGT